MDLSEMIELGFEKTNLRKALLITLPFNRFWDILISIQCFLLFIFTTSKLAFDVRSVLLDVFLHVTDVFYLIDVVCLLCYLRSSKLNKLTTDLRRHWFLILMDILSLIPMDLYVVYFYLSENKSHYITEAFYQNKCLRIYRVFQIELSYYRNVRSDFASYLVIIISLFTKVTLLGHLYTCIWYNMKKTYTCDPQEFNCILWYETTMLGVILLRCMSPNGVFVSVGEAILVISAMLSGFMLIYTFIYPLTYYFALLWSYNDCVYYSKQQQLTKFLENMHLKGPFRERVQNHFRYIWQDGENFLRNAALLSSFPLAHHKDICTDIYWEAFRHSYLLMDTSRNFKRLASVTMTTEYYEDKQIIYQKGQERREMIYIAQGVVQILAEENEESPLMSFSSGTVFSELSIFLYTRSPAFVRSKGFCELQILTYRGALAAMLKYPKDYRIIYQKLNQRILMAKHTQWRKKKFVEEKVSIVSKHLDFITAVDSVKWLKLQWRAVWQKHRRHLDFQKAKEEGTRLASWRNPRNLEIRIDFISNNLGLLILSDYIEEKKDMVCLKDDFPWSMNPSAQFLCVWYHLVRVLSLIPAMVYPVCTAWMDPFPRVVFALSHVISLIFIIDIFVKLMTAVSTRHQTLTSFTVVLRHHLSSMTFYLDIIAGVPYQIMIVIKPDYFDLSYPYRIGLLLHPTMLKAYVFFTARTAFGPYFVFLRSFKICVLAVLIIYLWAEVIQLVSIRKVIHFKHKVRGNWIRRMTAELGSTGILADYFFSFIKALLIMAKGSALNIYPESDWDAVLTVWARMIFTFASCIVISSFYSSIGISSYGWEYFQSRVKLVKNYLMEKNLSENATTSIIRGMRFQWDYNNGEQLLDDVTILRSMPVNMRKRLFIETSMQTLKATGLFAEESSEFLEEVLEISDFFAVPRGLLLVKYGQTSKHMMVISRGYCQISSNLTKDVSANVGASIKVGQSACFPVVSSFCGVPSPISVLTITECELIMIDIDKLLNIMIKHNMFKDLAEITDKHGCLEKLLDTKPALLMQESVAEIPGIKTRWRALFLLYRLSLYRVFLNQKFQKWWDISYAVYIIIVSIVWPGCFGLLLLFSHILLPILAVGKIFVFCNMFFLAFRPYYNDKGLEVVHPINTMLHYVTNSFIVDLMRLLPVYCIYYYGIVEPYEKPKLEVVGVLFFVNALNLIYINSFVDYVFRKFFSDMTIWCIKFVVISLLAINFYINFVMFINVKWKFGGPRKVVGIEYHLKKGILWKETILDCQLMLLYWFARTFSLNSVGHMNLRVELIYLSFFQNYFSLLLSFFIFSKMCTFTKSGHFMEHRLKEEFHSFIKYLKQEEIDESLVEQVKAYYNRWGKKEGSILSETFKQLPTYLSEELSYPLYRPTFVLNKVFEGSDEGFFRRLANTVSVVFFTRGSVVLFKGEVHSYIYFLHKGTCFVYDWFVTLEVGSIIGDIQQTGLMHNKVYALTHIELLRISTSEFFSILNCFYNIEADFMWIVKKSENFIKSNLQRDYYPLCPVDSEDSVNTFNLRHKKINFEDESHFEDPEDALIYNFRAKKPKDSRRWIINPRSLTMKLFQCLGFLDVILVMFFVPVFTCFWSLVPFVFIVFAVLDFVFLIYVISTFRMAVMNEGKGDVISNSKYIAKDYLRKGFFLDFLSLLPLDLIPLMFLDRQRSITTYVQAVRTVKCLRVYSFFRFRSNQLWTSSRSSARSIIFTIIWVLWFFIFLTLLFLRMVDEQDSDPLSSDMAYLQHFIKSLMYVSASTSFSFSSGLTMSIGGAMDETSQVNLITSTDLDHYVPKSKSQVYYEIFCIVCGFVFKAVLLNTVVKIFHLKYQTTFFFRTGISTLKSFLQKNQSSPIVIKNAVDYRVKLFGYTQAESGWFLTKTPKNLQMALMENLYIQHFLNFPLFQELDKLYLRQLIARANREVFFPGQKIVDQGDIDHRFYFIHSGEVYVLNLTKETGYIEYFVDKMHAGSYFGERQGLWFLKPHPYTYRARTVVELVTLFLGDWEDLREAFPEVTRKILEKAKTLQLI